MKPKADLNLIPVFLEVYKYQSISKAADALDITSASVSVSIKKLANQLSKELFVRQGRGITPTPYAERLAEQLEPMISQLESLLLSGGDGQHLDHNHQFIVYAPEPIILRSQNASHSLHKEGLPKISFKDLHLLNNESEELIRYKQTDAVIDISRVEGSAIINEVIADDEIVVVCAKNHPRISDTLTKEQFYKEYHYTWSYRSEGQPVFEFLSEEETQERMIAGVCSSLFSMMALVGECNSICIAPRKLVEKYAHKFELKMLACPVQMKRFNYYLIYHRRNLDSLAFKWLRETIIEQFEPASFGAVD